MDLLYLVLVTLLAPSLCQQHHSQRQELPDNPTDHYHGQDGQYNPSNDGRGWDIRLSVPGEPEVDYPTFNDIPPTSFNCIGKKNGYYADVETRCQVFRVCTTTGPSGYYSFLCPNGTLFNPIVQVCDWWMNVNCNGLDSETFSTGSLQINPGPTMFQNIKKMIMHPMNTPIPPNYPTDQMTTQVYNPPAEMMSMFVSPPKDHEGQQILGANRTPNTGLNQNKFSTGIKQDSQTSGTTSLHNNPIVVNEFLGTIANTPTVQEDLNSKFIQQQSEILNLQKQFNSNTEQQSIKITKQQFTYPSQFDKQYTVTVPRIPTPLHQPFVVNIPINIPAIDDNDNSVSEEMVMDETNNLRIFNNNDSYKYQHATTVASIPFVILLLKPTTEQTHNRLTETYSDYTLTNPSNFYNDHQNFIHSPVNRENAYSNSINYFYPQGFTGARASYTKIPSNQYIPSTNNINDNNFDEEENQRSLNDDITNSEYKEMTFNIDNAKDFQITETEQDLIMEQLNKHLDREEDQLTKDLKPNVVNIINSTDNNKLVAIFSANVSPNGDDSNEKVLQLCIPKDALLYLLKVHNATKRALQKYSNHHSANSNNHHSNEDMVNMLMQNVITKSNDFSDQQVPFVNDEELFRNQQYFQSQVDTFRNTNRKITDSVTSTRQNQGGRNQNVGVAQSVQNSFSGDGKYQSTSGQLNQGSFESKKINQHSGLVTNLYSAKFNKNQFNKEVRGSQQSGANSHSGSSSASDESSQDDTLDQYRITSSVDGPKNIEDEENRGEFFSLQHFGARQQQSQPQQNAGFQGNVKQSVQNNGLTNSQVSNDRGSNAANLQYSQNSQFQSVKGQNQISTSQQKDTLNGFAGLQQPSPFERTQNSPPQKNDNNRILNHNMAGFINNQPKLDIRTNVPQIGNQSDYSLSNIPNVSQTNSTKGGVYSYTHEVTKTDGPKVEYNKFHQYVQTTPGTTQLSYTEEQNVVNDNNEDDDDLPVVTKVTVGQKDETETSIQANLTPQVNTQYYQSSNYQGAGNAGIRGGAGQTQTTFSQTSSGQSGQTNSQRIGGIGQTISQTSTGLQNAGFAGQVNAQRIGGVGQTVTRTQTNGGTQNTGFVGQTNAQRIGGISQLSTQTNSGLQNNGFVGQTNTQRKGGTVQSVTQTQSNGLQNAGFSGQTNTQKQGVALQTSNTLQNSGFNGQTSSQEQSLNQGVLQGSAEGSTSGQSTGSVNENKYNQVLSIQKQLGGSNVPTPFMKTHHSHHKTHSSSSHEGQYETQVNIPDVQFVTRHNYHKKIAGQNQATNSQQNGYSYSNPGSNSLTGSTSQQVNGQKVQGNQQNGYTYSKPGSQFGIVNSQVNGQNGLVNKQTGYSISSAEANAQFGSNNQQIADRKNQINRIGSEFVTNQKNQKGGNGESNGFTSQVTTGQVNGGVNQFSTTKQVGTGSTQFVKNGNKVNGGNSQFVSTRFNNGQTKETLRPNVQIQGSNSFSVQGNGNNRPSTTGVQNGVQKAKFDQKTLLSSFSQTQQPSLPNQGFNREYLTPKVTTLTGTPQQRQFVTGGDITNGQNVVTNVQVVPAFGFSLDSDRERNYYYSALSRGLKDVDKIYIPPYDEDTANAMISEINRQAALGQFTPPTFEAMLHSFNSNPGFTVQAMLNNNFDAAIQPTFGVQFGGDNGNTQTIISDQQITSINDGNININQPSVSVENLGYPRERPRIPFTF